MRPIELKIKGLNSFNEEQTIDFDKLTERGLFGIFGPTGSGKSTVLDGITLALYGKVARESKNFINTNADVAVLMFKFQISGTVPKVYVVERSFKRNKEGNSVSHKVKLMDVTSGTPEILADMKTEVDKKCEEIIGLNLEDFTRTVVLPQGKFSEFLKLDGKPRREMLERLFNLQSYGDELSRKLARNISKEKSEQDVLLGQLKGYEDISEEGLKAKEEELKEVEATLNKENKDLEGIEKTFKEIQELWNLTEDLQGYNNEEEKLKANAVEIESYKAKVNAGEAALKVLPYIEGYEDTFKELQSANNEKAKLKEINEILKEKLEELQGQWNLWRNKKDEEVPKLRIKEEKIKDALNEQKNLEILVKDLKELEESIAIFERAEESALKDIETAEGRVQKGTKIINDTELAIEALKFEGIFKEMVQKGFLLNEKTIDLKALIKEEEEKYSIILKEINNSKESLSKFEEVLKKNSEALLSAEENLKELLSNAPGKNEDLVALQRRLMESTDKWVRYNTAIKTIKESTAVMAEIESAIKVKGLEKEKLEEQIEELKKSLEDLQVENIAHSLRTALKEGDTCPVCGSKEHHVEAIKIVPPADIKELKAELASKELKLKQLEKEITGGETTVKGIKDRIDEKNKEIDSLGQEFKQETVQELEGKFNSLKEAIADFDNKKEKLEEVIKQLSEEKLVVKGKLDTITSMILQGKKQSGELESNLKKNKLSLENLEKEMSQVKGESGVEDFKVVIEEIKAKEEKREHLEKELKRYRKALEDIMTGKEAANKKLTEVREILVKENSTRVAMLKNKQEKEAAIEAKAGKEAYNLEGFLNKIITNIKAIEEGFAKCDKDKNTLEEEFKKCNEGLIEIAGKVSDLERRLLEEEGALNKVVKEEGFTTVQQVKDNFLSKDKLQQLKELIENHNNSLAKIIGAKESILKKIAGRTITKEQWLQLQQTRVDKEARVKEINEARIRVEEEVNLIGKKIEQLKELMEKRVKLEHKLSLLSDLDKLFKGKKFVEFVAAERLKYVSIEASKRLKEISSGQYGLEADENGKFIIRDYKNGGSARDASTLSGGETFLTSLSLALALSAEIQLKGTAPLELFFLDEGFGTLDENLLEVVMSSLERIHNEKLKVGIISHVESIKNRIPVKLMVNPAESGRGGSKVRIERS